MKMLNGPAHSKKSKIGTVQTRFDCRGFAKGGPGVPVK